MTLSIEHNDAVYRFGGSGNELLLVDGQCETPDEVRELADASYDCLYEAFCTGWVVQTS
jgi:hypothetical protein